MYKCFQVDYSDQTKNHLERISENFSLVGFYKSKEYPIWVKCEQSLYDLYSNREDFKGVDEKTYATFWLKESVNSWYRVGNGNLDDPTL